MIYAIFWNIKIFILRNNEIIVSRNEYFFFFSSVFNNFKELFNLNV